MENTLCLLIRTSRVLYGVSSQMLDGYNIGLHLLHLCKASGMYSVHVATVHTSLVVAVY
mgnify:CR=1 FL=1|jgi:hypothetical protein